MTMHKKVAVLGGGSFGTVLANTIASNQHPVSLWVRDSDDALRINSEGANKPYHPELKLSENILASDNLKKVLEGSMIVLVVTPSIVFENIINRIINLIEPNAHIVSCTKGIKADPFLSMSDIIKISFAKKNNKIGVLSGPNLAKEIADNQVTGTVIASKSNNLIEDVKKALSSTTFKVYSSNDMQGVELAGALKNIYAIICGMADSMKLGENTIGLILTRSMAEMSRFAVAKGADPTTFLGLAGMGDLVSTCTSNLSRNFQLGHYLGLGQSLKEAKDKVGQVAEGIRTLEVVKKESAIHGISMPLVDSLHAIIHNQAKPSQLIKDLINNPNEIDVEFANIQY